MVDVVPRSSGSRNKTLSDADIASQSPGNDPGSTGDTHTYIHTRGASPRSPFFFSLDNGKGAKVVPGTLYFAEGFSLSRPDLPKTPPLGGYWHSTLTFPLVWKTSSGQERSHYFLCRLNTIFGVMGTHTSDPR